jgi:hypothetical protein
MPIILYALTLSVPTAVVFGVLAICQRARTRPRRY